MKDIPRLPPRGCKHRVPAQRGHVEHDEPRREQLLPRIITEDNAMRKVATRLCGNSAATIEGVFPRLISKSLKRFQNSNIVLFLKGQENRPQMHQKLINIYQHILPNVLRISKEHP